MNQQSQYVKCEIQMNGIYLNPAAGDKNGRKFDWREYTKRAVVLTINSYVLCE